MTRVSDFAQNQLTLFYLSNTQQKLLNTQNQISTGKVADSFAGIGSDSSRLVSLQNAEARVNQYLNNAQIVDQRLTSMETDTSQLFTIASKFKTLLVNGLNADQSSDLNLGQQAQDLLNQVQGLLNSQLDGRYLFSGSATDTSPVDVNAAGFAAPGSVYPGPPDTGYYQGNNTTLSARVDDNYDLKYGITADSSGFEELIRSLRLATTANLGPPQDQNRLEESLRVVNQAIQDIPDITSQIGSARAAIQDITAKHTDFKQFADQAIGDISNVDVTQAVSILSENQTTLQASYQVVARLSQLNLAHFLPA
jgi:flagellar hook-associated protein 3 FlgL